LHGRGANTPGIGARISLFEDRFVQAQEMMAGGRYLSSDQPLRVFAVQADSKQRRLEVAWRSGARTLVDNVSPNVLLEIFEPQNQPEAKAKPSSNSPPSPTLFEEASAKLAHRHMESSFDDFARQPLLPNRLSQLGPALAWQDFDGDGWEDLAIGTGRGGRLAILRNDTRGGFQPLTPPGAIQPEQRDLGGILGLRTGEAAAQMIIVRQSYEDGPGVTNGSSLISWNPVSGATESLQSQARDSFGPLAVADIDADGDLDLFMGGRCLPGNYPSPASSILFRRDRQTWTKDKDEAPALSRSKGRFFDNVGLVSGAVFSDLDQDGYAELILACEWGPLRLYRNQKGTLTPHDPPVTGLPGVKHLSDLTGWWNSVITCDLNEDGRPDLIAGNWGANSKYRATAKAPRRIYYGDFNQGRRWRHFGSRLG
jgi:hypothetical protein